MKIRKYYNLKALDQDLRILARSIRKRLRLDKDIVMAITGTEGTGKTTLGMILGALIDGNFDLEKNISYIPSENEIRQEFNNLKQYQCYMIDEAIRALYKMNFMSNLQQMLVRMWATERYQNKATILILPRFKDLTENFRNHRVRLWTNVIERGHAIVYLKDTDAHISDPWHMDETYKYKQKMYRNRNPSMLPIEERVRIESKTRNFLAYIQFPDMPKEVKEEYVRLRQISRDNYEKELAQKNETNIGKLAKELREQRDKLIYLLIRKTSFNYQKLMEHIDLTKRSLMRIVKNQDKIFRQIEEEKQRELETKGVDKHIAQAIALQMARNKNF